MSSKLWSRSRIYTTLADGRGLPPKVEITHSAKAEAEIFDLLCETYPYVRTTVERTTWFLGVKVVELEELRKKSDRQAAAGE